MIPIILLPLLSVMMMERPNDPVTEFIPLLTEKQWTLVRYGIDDNKNGSIDDFENDMAYCNRDDTYVFHTDGTGHYDDHTLSCGNGITDLSFQWNFTDDQTLKSLPTGAAHIEIITKDHLVLSSGSIDTTGRTITRIIELRHELSNHHSTE